MAQKRHKKVTHKRCESTQLTERESYVSLLAIPDPVNSEFMYMWKGANIWVNSELDLDLQL